MKKEYIIIVGAILTLFVIFSIVGYEETPDHPTLNQSAIMPDKYMEDVTYYEKMERYDKSADNLEHAIKAIWKIQADVDEESFDRLEDVIVRLERLHSKLVKDSIHMNFMKEDFNYALHNLAHAELEIAEMYAETNDMDKATLALKYAQLHIKNAMLYHNPYWSDDNAQENMVVERRIFSELDSLINTESASVADNVLYIDKIIKEVDYLIASEQ